MTAGTISAGAGMSNGLKTVPRELRRCGMAAPVVAAGGSAPVLLAAARQVWPESRAQSSWCHKLVKVLDKLPPAPPAPRQARSERDDVRRVARGLRGESSQWNPIAADLRDPESRLTNWRQYARDEPDADLMRS